MSKRILSGIMLILLLVGMFTLAFDIQPVEAGGTIYIKPDGSIEPSTANITTVDYITYIFTDNNYDEIVVERDNIVVDGAGYTLQGTGVYDSSGITCMHGRSNVTINNVEIKAFYYGVRLFESSNIVISGNNITANNGYGIWVYYFSSNIVISGNNIANNGIGIWLGYSSNNSISGNNITNNNNGIQLEKSYNNSISGNSITSNGGGISLHDSSYNTLRNNDASNNEYNFGVSGSLLSHYIQDMDDSNTVNGKPVYYWVNRRDMAVPLDAGWIALINCTRMTVKNLNLTDNGQGVLLAFTTDSTITKNNITNNNDGIGLDYSSNNTISGNNIANNGAGIPFDHSKYNSISGNNITANNGYGIQLCRSSNYNKFYHNNFVDNGEQVDSDGSTNVWDDGYPSGGNYWSDYTDVDSYCGPNQNVKSRDGIWDHPYVIDENNQDNYPLVKPYEPGSLSVSIYTDKDTYHAGETMHLGLDIENPDSVKYLDFAIWVERPGGSIYLYMHKHSIVLPIGTVYSNPDFESITLPSLAPGTYTWHAAFLRRKTHKIIVEDTAEWEFSIT